MNKLFTKKPLWAPLWGLVFAAAAIFAVTMVACSNDTTNNTEPPREAAAGDAVEYVSVGGQSVWQIAVADDDGKVSVPKPSAAGFYKLTGEIVKKEEFIEVTTANTFTPKTALTANTVYEVLFLNGTTFGTAYAYQGATVPVVTGTFAIGYKVISVKANASLRLAGSDGKITISGISAATYFAVTTMLAGTTAYVESSDAGVLTLTPYGIYKVSAALTTTTGTGSAADVSTDLTTVAVGDIVKTTLCESPWTVAYAAVADGKKLTLTNAKVFALEIVLPVGDAYTDDPADIKDEEWYKTDIYAADGITTEYVKSDDTNGIVFAGTAIATNTPEVVTAIITAASTAEAALDMPASGFANGDIVKVSKIDGAANTASFTKTVAIASGKITMTFDNSTSYVVEKIGTITEFDIKVE